MRLNVRMRYEQTQVLVTMVDYETLGVMMNLMGQGGEESERERVKARVIARTWE